MRRLPVYLVLDCSSSMHGEPIEAIRQGMNTLLSELKSDPRAVETAFLSVITFDSDARQVIPLTDIRSISEPQLQANGRTALGAALTLLHSCIEEEVRKGTEEEGDWRPLIFLMTDGEPTDSWKGPAEAIKQARPGNFIACAAGAGANEDVLKRIAELVVRLNDLEPGTLEKFFEWVSATAKPDGGSMSLPPPPPEVQILP